jgi:hypothetical protein
MSTHLTSQQLAEAILSTETPDHLRECAACRAELADLRATLGEFRNATRKWTEQENARPASARGRAPSYALRTCAVAALALLAFAGGLTYSAGSHKPDPADTALLERVSAGVSRTVPGSLEPLTVQSYR